MHQSEPSKGILVYNVSKKKISLRESCGETPSLGLRGAVQVQKASGGVVCVTDENKLLLDP